MSKFMGFAIVRAGESLEDIMEPLSVEMDPPAPFRLPCYCGTLALEEASQAAFVARAGPLLAGLGASDIETRYRELQAAWNARCDAVAARFATGPAPVRDCGNCGGAGSLDMSFGHFDSYWPVEWTELLQPAVSAGNHTLPFDYILPFYDLLGAYPEEAFGPKVRPPALPSELSTGDLLALTESGWIAGGICVVGADSTWHERLEHESNGAWWQRARAILVSSPEATAYALAFHT